MAPRAPIDHVFRSERAALLWLFLTGYSAVNIADGVPVSSRLRFGMKLDGCVRYVHPARDAINSLLMALVP